GRLRATRTVAIVDSGIAVVEPAASAAATTAVPTGERYSTGTSTQEAIPTATSTTTTQPRGRSGPARSPHRLRATWTATAAITAAITSHSVRRLGTGAQSSGSGGVVVGTP